MPERALSPPPAEWRRSYLLARAREGRLLPDGLVAALPALPPAHPLSAEWAQRADSARRLLAHLARRPRPLRVVDLGCGCGWLSARIADLPTTHVTGVDATAEELAQARRVFGDRRNLRFVEADLTTVDLRAGDVVVLASVLQYLAAPAELLRRWLSEVGAAGEVHVLDSPIYRAEHVDAARARTAAHYASIGVPEMAARYHHHTWREHD